MGNWQDRLNRISKPAASEREVLESIETTAAMLGFDMVNRSMTFSASQLWSEARLLGLCHGLSEEDFTLAMRGGPLPSAPSPTPPVNGKLGRREIRMRWFAFVVHLVLDQQRMARPTGQGQSPLTERELEVLKLTAQGKTSSEIAALLMVSGNTVNFHIRNAMLKLQARNKTAAAVCAALQGWLNG